MRYFSLHPSLFKLDGGAMFGIIPKPLWEKSIPSDEENRIEMGLRVVAMQGHDGQRDRLVVIDTGIGDIHDSKFYDRFGVTDANNPLVNALREVGRKPEEVTDIILTHLHFDHAGGLMTGDADHLEAVFPEARLHLHRKHYEYALRPSARDAGSFYGSPFQRAVAFYEQCGQLEWLDGEEGQIFSELGGSPLRFKVSHGHTPYQIHPFNDDIFILADTVPTQHHLKLPWVMGYDLQPAVSTEVKEKFYRFISDNDLLAVFDHDKNAIGAKLTQTEKKGKQIWEWSSVVSCSRSSCEFSPGG